jgi:hypothetical protein
VDDDSNKEGEDDRRPDSEGANLAAEFFQLAQQKGVQLNAEDLEDEDEDDEEDDEVPPVVSKREQVTRSVKNDEEDDDDDDDDEEEMNYPAGAINAFLGYDTGGDAVGGLAGNVTLTDNQLYSEVKERVLDTAGGFVKFVKGAKDEEGEEEDEDDDDDDDEEGTWLAGKKRTYVPPMTVPDSELTAGEVVFLILDALLNNDNPTPNKGVEILFGYSSPGSSIKNEQGLTPAEYADFLRETEYKVLFNHQGVTIDKGDYSFDGKKAFFTARLQTGSGPLDTVSVNFILSTTGREDDACWLIDSMLIRPQSMRRRRRK